MLRNQKITDPGSTLSRSHVRFGSMQAFCNAEAMSALPPKADIPGGDQHVCFVPIADIRLCSWHTNEAPCVAR